MNEVKWVRVKPKQNELSKDLKSLISLLDSAIKSKKEELVSMKRSNNVHT